MGKTKHPLLGHSILAKKDTWLIRFPADPECLEAEEKLFVACAMLLKTLDERSFEDYEDYLETVSDIGDGTEAWVQIKALSHYDLNAEFRQDGDWSVVEELIDRGIPVPLGILHFGPVENPGGSGHWIVAVGLTKDRENLIVHDPYGDLDLYSGVYTSECGSFRKYPKKHLSDRWMVEKGYSSGWYIKAQQ